MAAGYPIVRRAGVEYRFDGKAWRDSAGRTLGDWIPSATQAPPRGVTREDCAEFAASLPRLLASEERG